MAKLIRRNFKSLRIEHGVFAAVFLLRLFGLARLSSSALLLPSQGDMRFYNDWALRIMHGHWTDHRAFYGLPLYPYLLAGIYKVCGYNPFLPGFIQAIFEGGTSVLIYKLSCLLFGPKQHASSGSDKETPNKLEESSMNESREHRRSLAIGLTASLGWGFFQPAEAYSVILMPTAGMIFVYWFVVWWLVKSRQRPNWKQFLLVGLLIGFTAMGIATILILLPLLLAALLLRWSRSNIRSAAIENLTSVTALTLGIVVGSSPCWMHNYFVAKDPVFLSAHSGINYWIGNNPTANGYPKFPPGLRASQEGMLKDSVTRAEEAAGHPLTRSQVSAYWSSKARSYIQTNSLAWLKLIGVKVRNFWSAFQYDDLSIVTTSREQAVILPGLSFGLVAALAAPGLVVSWRRFRTSRWIAAAVLLQMFALLPVFITERYRLAAVPGLLVFGACGLWQLGEFVFEGRYKRTIIYVTILTFATYFVSMPVSDASLWALDSYNSGLQALESNRLNLAEKKLSFAYNYSPENAEVNFALGNLRLAQGKPSAAQSYYLSAINLNSHHEGAYNNLGVIALAEERLDAARGFLTKARELDPKDPTICYLLAQTYSKSGDKARAETMIDQAIALGPIQPEYLALRDKLRNVASQ